MADVVQAFVRALAKLEREGDVETIGALFADACEVGNAVLLEPLHGKAAARAFWKQYRDAFGTIRSTFRAVVEGEGQAALEWTSTGTSRGGETFSYGGVSVLDFEDGKVTRFMAYFDPGELDVVYRGDPYATGPGVH